MLIRPPTHKVDAGGVFISASDCWDNDKLDAEHEARKAKALAAKQDAAVEGKTLSADEESAVREAVTLTSEEELSVLADSPLARYLGGKTRFQPDAPDWDANGEPVTVRDYLAGQPTEFAIRRLGFQEFRDISSMTGPVGQTLLEMTALGLREIRSPKGGLSWKAGKGEERVPDDVLQALHEADLSLISEIGTAVARYNRPLDAAEGGR